MNKGRKVFVVSKKKRGLSYQASQGIKKVEKFLKVFMISKKTKGLSYTSLTRVNKDRYFMILRNKAVTQVKLLYYFNQVFRGYYI